MEAFLIALFIVLIACVAAVVYNNSKKQPEQAVPPAEILTPETSTAHEPVEAMPVEPEPVPSEQHTIYAFEREVQVQVCPRCDGENSMGRQICCICGFEFRKGVWGV